MRGSAVLEAFASSIGMTRTGRDRWGPCPSCGASSTRSDRRPPVRIRNDWWTCYACGEWGDAISMAGALIGLGTRLTGRDFLEAKARVDGQELPKVAPAERAEPVVLPVRPALSGAVPVSRAPYHVKCWLRERGLPDTIPAGYLPQSPRWFPSGFPLVVPAYSGSGELMSMHGRGVDSTHKTAWPMGPWPCELLLLDPRWARPWVQGRADAPDVLILAEGITDYWTAAMEYPTIGITSGSIPALRMLRVPSSTRVYSAMDPDRPGARYEDGIADALWPTPVRPLPLRRLSQRWT